ncbi:MAG: YlbF family regulator [Anaerolineales bacterium]|nr:YlbF family regulator [Anaerolineales bacterium]
MELKTATNLAESITDTTHALVEALDEMPICRAFIQAMDLANHDPEVQRLLRAIYEAQGAGFSARKSGPTLAQLQTELEALPVVVSLRQAERGMREILTAVDDIISQVAGVPFAANAKRSCCG